MKLRKKTRNRRRIRIKIKVYTARIEARRKKGKKRRIENQGE